MIIRTDISNVNLSLTSLFLLNVSRGRGTGNKGPSHLHIFNNARALLYRYTSEHLKVLTEAGKSAFMHALEQKASITHNHIHHLFGSDWRSRTNF